MEQDKKKKWEISKHATPEYAPQYGIHDGGPIDFCIVKGKNAEEKAKLICKSVNLYNEFVKSCELTIQALEDHLQYDDGKSLERDAYEAAVDLRREIENMT